MNTEMQNLPTYIREKIPNAIVPVVFAEAMRALVACRSIDESKHWADKADALAAWAKIYKNDEAAREAKRLKLHAYRRMGKLAEELKPTERRFRHPGRGGAGSVSLLRQSGLSGIQAIAARRVASLQSEDFQREVRRKSPRAPATVGKLAIGKLSAESAAKAATQAWRTLFCGGAAGSFKLFCRGNSAYELATALDAGEVNAARKNMREIREWLDEFDASLPPEQQ